MKTFTTNEQKILNDWMYTCHTEGYDSYEDEENEIGLISIELNDDSNVVTDELDSTIFNIEFYCDDSDHMVKITKN
jgi:hypothetical protein